MTTINQSDKVKVIITDDGSNTIYLPELDETYHSKFGAINEARHVFIENGMANFSKSELSILEIGFGTGLNALLTLIYASENKLNVNYTTFEKYPLDKEVVAALNFDKLLEDKNNYLVKIHDLEWEKSHQITGFFNLEKKEADVLDKNLLFPGKFDLIYFDAFAPSKQAEMWDESLFSKLYALLRTGGKLVTYSAAGIVKRALRNAGFFVKRLPGPLGKHHMLMSTKL